MYDVMSARIVDIVGSDDEATITQEGVIDITVTSDFSEPIVITIEFCVTSCSECGTQTLTLTNEALQDIIQTTFIDRGDADLASLVFTKEDILLDAEVWIYNRWGQEIYYSDAYENDWAADGYPAGIYFYVIKRGELVIKQTLTVFD